MRIATISILAVLLLLAPRVALAAPTAAVIVNKGAESEPTAIDNMARTLGTDITRPLTRGGFVRDFTENDIVYVNTHMYGAGGRHVIDRMMGKRGTIVIGDTAWSGRSDRDLVSKADVAAALKNSAHRPQIVVIAGCSADAFGWRGATGARVEIMFKTAIIGQAADVYFSYFFKGWKEGMTVDQALAYADKAALEDPTVKDRWVTLGHGIEALIKQRAVYGDRNARFTDATNSPKPKPPVVKLPPSPKPPVVKHPSPKPSVVVVVPPKWPTPKPSPSPKPSVKPSPSPSPSSPLSVSLNGPDVLEVGEAGDWKANVSGGVPPYRITWHKGTTGTAYHATASKAGNFRVSVKVTDSGARSKTPLEVGKPVRVVERLNVRIAGATRVQVNQRVELRASASGGTSPYQVQWRGPKGGTVPNVWGLGGSFKTPGKYAYTVEVWDKGRHAKPHAPVRATVTIEVVAATATRTGGLSDVDVSQRNIRMSMRDHGMEDGDIITVKLNGRVVVSGLRLTNRGNIVALNLQPGANELTVFAHNEGTSPPNTAELKFSNIIRGSNTQHYNLKKGQTARMVLKAP